MMEEALGRLLEALTAMYGDAAIKVEIVVIDGIAAVQIQAIPTKQETWTANDEAELYTLLNGQEPEL